MSRYLLTVLISAFLGLQTVNAQIDYKDTIQPIFDNHCQPCHGGLGGVSLESYQEVMSSIAASYDTLIVIPGKPFESPLVDVISSDEPQFGGRMPPGDSLSVQQIEDIIQWIEEGAHESVQTSGEIFADLPDTYRLNGNYPNPFNPSTIIQFEVPQTTDYLLSVYSVTGKLIREHQGTARAGVAEVSLDMSRQPSGVYIYRIRFSSNRNDTRFLTGQMTLIK